MKKKDKQKFDKYVQGLHKFQKIINDNDHKVYRTPLPKGKLYVNKECFDTESISYLSLSDRGCCCKVNGEWFKVPFKDLFRLEYKG